MPLSFCVLFLSMLIGRLKLFMCKGLSLYILIKLYDKSFCLFGSQVDTAVIAHIVVAVFVVIFMWNSSSCYLFEWMGIPLEGEHLVCLIIITQLNTGALLKIVISFMLFYFFLFALYFLVFIFALERWYIYLFIPRETLTLWKCVQLIACCLMCFLRFGSQLKTVIYQTKKNYYLKCLLSIQMMEVYSVVICVFEECHFIFNDAMIKI